jgi:hypothetical protein
MGLVITFGEGGGESTFERSSHTVSLPPTQIHSKGIPLRESYFICIKLLLITY